jgi:hypothetical protein
MMDERVGGLSERSGEMPVGVATGMPGSMDQAKAYMVRLREAVNKFDEKDLRRVTGWSFKSTALGDTLGEPTTPTGKATKWAIKTYEPWRKEFEGFLLAQKAATHSEGSMGSILATMAFTEKKSGSELWNELEKWETDFAEHQRKFKSFGFSVMSPDAGELGYVGPLTVAKKVLGYTAAFAVLGGLGYVGFRYWKTKRDGVSFSLSESSSDAARMASLRQMMESSQRRRAAFPAAAFTGNDCRVCGATCGDDDLCDSCRVATTGKFSWGSLR